MRIYTTRLNAKFGGCATDPSGDLSSIGSQKFRKWRRFHGNRPADFHCRMVGSNVSRAQSSLLVQRRTRDPGRRSCGGKCSCSCTRHLARPYGDRSTALSPNGLQSSLAKDHGDKLREIVFVCIQSSLSRLKGEDGTTQQWSLWIVIRPTGPRARWDLSALMCAFVLWRMVREYRPSNQKPQIS